MEERDDLIMLFDEDGNEVPFEHLDTFEMNEKVYVVLLEVIEDEENDEVVILRLEKDDNDEDTLVIIEDDNELQEAFEEFSDRVEDQFEVEDEE